MALAFLTNLRRALSPPDIAIDLGTANTRLYANGRGLIADEPTIIKVKAASGSVEAVGAHAVNRFFSNANSDLVSPLHEGVITDVDAATALLTPLIKRARYFGWNKPRVLACAPTDACENERAALVEATRRAGASAVVLAPEPLAAAIGIGLDVASPYAQMLVDIGDGVTDIAIIRSGQLVTTAAQRTAYGDLIVKVSQLIAEQHQLDIYHSEAVRLTLKVGAHQNQVATAPFVVAGADQRTGSQRRVYVYGQDVANVMAPVLRTIVGTVREAVKTLPDDVACEVIENGIQLTGGGACLPGLADLLAAETSLTVHPARNPMHAVINGARQMLEVGVQTDVWTNA